jgi:glucose/mannose transport system substrate-binding protein
MQIHGDWMKGEWRNAGKVAGKDFGCVNIPGTKALSVTVDAWGLLGGPSVDEAHKAAELQFAKIVVDPQVTAEFAAKKGSSPVRLDAPTASLDKCNLLVLDSLKKPGFSVQSPFNISDADWVRSIWDVMFKYWGDPKMRPDDVIAQMKAQYNTIFG